MFNNRVVCVLILFAFTSGYFSPALTETAPIESPVDRAIATFYDARQNGDTDTVAIQKAAVSIIQLAAEQDLALTHDQIEILAGDLTKALIQLYAEPPREATLIAAAICGTIAGDSKGVEAAAYGAAAVTGDAYAAANGAAAASGDTFAAAKGAAKATGDADAATKGAVAATGDTEAAAKGAAAGALAFAYGDKEDKLKIAQTSRPNLAATQEDKKEKEKESELGSSKPLQPASPN